MAAPTGFTTLTANRIQDAAGNVLNGSINVVATDNNDLPVDAVAGGDGGPIVTSALFAYEAGVLAPNSWVPDSALTTNPHTSYRFSFLDLSGRTLRVWRGVQPTGATLNLDTYKPDIPAQAVVQYGPAGTIAIRNVTAGPVPTVYNAGTPGQAILDIVLPQGVQGAQGNQGPAGVNSVVGSISGSYLRQTYTAGGSTTAFTMPGGGLPHVYRNGMLQEPGLDYSQSGTTVTFTFTPDSGDRITIIVFPAS